MEKPFKYSIFCLKKRKIIYELDSCPLLRDLQTWEEISRKTKELQQTRVAYTDTRHTAKKRLWEYITFTKKGLPIPKYSPFIGTEIGKSTPILNF